MSLFTDPPTDAERRGWQLRGARALVDLLTEAHKAGLPPLAWTVNTSGLVGRWLMVPPSTRESFEQWAALLAADGPVERWPETDHGGRVHLHVTRKRWRGRTDVTVFTDIYEGTED